MLPSIVRCNLQADTMAYSHNIHCSHRAIGIFPSTARAADVSVCCRERRTCCIAVNKHLPSLPSRDRATARPCPQPCQECSPWSAGLGPPQPGGRKRSTHRQDEHTDRRRGGGTQACQGLCGVRAAVCAALPRCVGLCARLGGVRARCGAARLRD